MTVSIEKASGKAYCRGGGCGWRKKIPAETKCLRVSVYGAGGSETAFYCEKCMKPILDSFAKALNDAEKDVAELE
jgi:hypothetical protein